MQMQNWISQVLHSTIVGASFLICLKILIITSYNLQDKFSHEKINKINKYYGALRYSQLGISRKYTSNYKVTSVISMKQVVNGMDRHNKQPESSNRISTRTLRLSTNHTLHIFFTSSSLSR
jgi:hypothetical protein